MKKLISNSKGSILMEAVIVMPLYMLLFGGMMLIGDMVLGGVNLYDSNRMLAWMAMDRFGIDDNFLVQQAQKGFEFTGENSITSSNGDPVWKFDESQKAKAYWAGIYNQGGSEYVTSNTYLALFKGAMPLKMNKIPMLYQGLLAVNDVMNRPDKVKNAENGQDEGLLYKTVFDLGKDEWFAHYVVKRQPRPEKDAAPPRDLCAAELVVTNSWIDIIGDNWIKRQNTQTESVDNSGNVTSDDLAGYIRSLEAFAGAVEQ